MLWRAFLLLALAGAAAPVGDAGAGTLAGREPLTHAFAEALVAQAIDPAGVGLELAIVIDEPQLPLGNQSAETTEVTLEGLAFDRPSGRFQGELVGRIGDRVRFRLPARGQAITLIEVPVLSRPLQRGERVQADDIAWLAVRPDRLPAGGLTDADLLIGAEARRPLRAGKMLGARDVGPPRLVERGRPVRIVYARPGLRLTTVGTAQDGGTEGDLVRVLNPTSHRQVQGVVTGPDEVTVDAAAELSP